MDKQQLTPTGLWTHALQNEFDLRPFVCEGDPELASLLSFHGHLAYKLRATVGAMCRPGRILEIGCRAGYGAAALLSYVPRAACVLVDRDEFPEGAEHWGGAPGLFDYAREMLPRCFGTADLRFLKADSQADPMSWLCPLVSESPFDLVVVDGDKTRAGYARDLESAYFAVQSGGFLVFEGYTKYPGAMAAVDAFLFGSVSPHLYCCTPDGLVLVNVYKK